MTVHEWFESGMDYWQGVEILSRTCRLNALMGTLKRGPNPYNVGKLENEMRKLRSAESDSERARGIQSGERKSEGPVQIFVKGELLSENNEVDLSGVKAQIDKAIKEGNVKTFSFDIKPDDVEVIAIEQEWKGLYKEASTLQGELDHMRSDKKRGEAVRRIMEIMDELVPPLWEKMDYYRQHGVLPSAKSERAESGCELPDDPIKLMNRRNTLKSYISKVKKGELKKYTVEELQVQLAEVEDKLNAIQNREN